MKNNNPKKHSLFNPGIILGSIIILLGILFLLDNLGVSMSFEVWDFWPVLIILFGLNHIFDNYSQRISIFGIFITAVGVLFLLDELEYIRFNIGDLWPLVLVMVGFFMVRHHLSGGKTRRGGGGCPFSRKADINDQDYLNISAILGGGEYRFSSESFKGGKLTAIMGGGEIDLRDALMDAEHAELEVFILMGGFEIFLPKDWNVTIQASPLLGGIDDKTRSTSPVKKNLVITGTVFMGGLDLKN